MVQFLYHCQFFDYTVCEDPVDYFIWASNDREAVRLLRDAIKEDETLDGEQLLIDNFDIFTVYAHNGGRVSRNDVADGQVWFSPNRIAELGLIKDNKGKGNYRFVIRLIKEGKLKSKQEKGGFFVHRSWIEEYNDAV